MKKSISLSDFSFRLVGHGHYKVTYTSPATGKEFSKSITDMTVIDNTKYSDSPKIKDLNDLKATCKSPN